MKKLVLGITIAALAVAIAGAPAASAHSKTRFGHAPTTRFG